MHTAHSKAGRGHQTGILKGIVMRTVFRTALLLLVATFSATTVAGEDQQQAAELQAQAKSIVRTFGDQLKPRLKSAIQSGGLVHAINVCAAQAPAIAANLALETGWDVKRVSLQARNKTSATPDDFERKVLEDFDARQKAGESPATMEFSAIEDGSFRFMRAQRVDGLCLSCHGTAIDDGVKKALETYYPQDSATGYSLGQVRGAFSLSKRL